MLESGNAYLTTRARYKNLPRTKGKYENYYFAINQLHKLCWIPIHYQTYLTKSPTVSVYSFHMIFHVTISDFCSVPLFLSVFVPSLGGQIRVSTLYHQSYWYCWWSILHEKIMPIDIQNFPSVIHLAKVRNNQYSFVLISPSLNNLSFICSYIIDSFCCWNFYWVLRSILLSTLCVKNECHVWFYTGLPRINNCSWCYTPHVLTNPHSHLCLHNSWWHHAEILNYSKVFRCLRTRKKSVQYWLILKLCSGENRNTKAVHVLRDDIFIAIFFLWSISNSWLFPTYFGYFI